ncbi:Inorganic pyrophosphatase [Coemansia sp. RSA 2706]|nr:Inorganic pyrophosphatase [Coemansia sp. RSA 2711]KAJ1849890.1 Inorganic pyrophosphatase [Coemansia sp. RSA 2708]KAJ2285688.1 Inorganic pyrophosphatase [Coemansia sp. RSA 2706]KAJ2296250.1 Inorganic pyrophosphatase [Coemansia sp. RSA 2705]KAJ2303051.1 Inorganic pyrophosphatase [Coemansia sp. RSA 2704]KAJ2310867.1 Inorganic pyrophosphatase [Coemansia sp. RSA 2702]KAJ2354409.1 Inorganic pyrophosphatase [Coemansia sp. RSA 2611]KAJ2355449.1 Inorganic pyrophosphatase [Coemansia sp. RSA 2610]K
MSYTTRAVGEPNTLDYRVFIEKDGKVVSPFHDIPLFADEANGIYNMVVEIPRWTNAKMEISKEDALNPIKQDTKKGKLRYVRNAFPHHGYIWNYGALPQTWEDPNQTNTDTKCVGDNDPIDVCEIGEDIGYTGQVKQVKILGVMALIDEGETDWKVLAIDVNDPLAAKMKDVGDIERYMPGLLHATNEWFRIYKIPDGKPENKFAFGGEAKKKDYALDVIKETAEAWSDLTAGKSAAGKIALANTQCNDANTVSAAEADKITEGAVGQTAPAIDQSLHKWFFISGSKI